MGIAKIRLAWMKNGVSVGKGRVVGFDPNTLAELLNYLPENSKIVDFVDVKELKLPYRSIDLFVANDIFIENGVINPIFSQERKLDAFGNIIQNAILIDLDYSNAIVKQGN